jgi:hypothetical protein
VNFCKENSENPELTDRQAKKLIHWRVPTFLNTKTVCVCVCVCVCVMGVDRGVSGRRKVQCLNTAPSHM